MTTYHQKFFWIAFVSLILVSLLVFASIAFLNWSLLTGFIIGTIVSLINYFISVWFTRWLLSKRRSFKFGCFITLIKWVVFTCLFSLLFIGILFANNFYCNSYINGIFNIFAFIYGVVTVGISIAFSIAIEKVYQSKKSKD